MRIRYKAVDRDGKISRGLLDAKSEDEAVGYLRQKQLTPISVDRMDNKFWESLPFFSKKVKGTELILFTRQLSSMIQSGLTLTKSLEILRTQIKNPTFVEVITTIINDIQEGKSFGTALEKHPNVFSHIYVSIVKAGEQSGLLDKVLTRLTENLEKQAKLKATVKSALTYPAIVVIGMVAVMFVMAFFVMPTLNDLFTSMNVELPITTKILIWSSKFIVGFWWLLGIITALIFYAFKSWASTTNGKLILDSTMLKLPIFGKLINLSIQAEFTRTFGLLVGTGTLVVQSLVETADTTGNSLYKAAILDVSKMVEKGVSIGDAMSSYTLFPAMLIQLVKVGEQTGKIDESLIKASEYFEREVDQLVGNLTTLLSPIIMLILGIGVAVILFSVITPIYSLITAIQ